MLRLTGEHRTNLDTLNRTVLNLLSLGLSNLFTCGTDKFTGDRMYDIVNRYTTQNALIKRRDDFVAILKGCAVETTECAAVFLGDDNVMRYVNQTTRQVTGVGSLQSGIGQTLTGTVGRNKVFQHGHTLLKVRDNGVLNDKRLGTGLLRLGHQTTHTRELANLSLTTTSSRVKHHVHSIEALVGLLHFLHQDFRQVVVDVSPGVDDLVVAFLICDKAHSIVLSNTLYFIITTVNEGLLLLGDNDISKVE